MGREHLFIGVVEKNERKELCEQIVKGGGGENLDGGVVPSFAEDEEDDEDDGKDEEDGDDNNDDDGPNGEARAVGQISARAQNLLGVAAGRVKLLQVAVAMHDGARVGIVVGIEHSDGAHVFI